jgi:outer membrane protein assembly factor BamB
VNIAYHNLAMHLRRHILLLGFLLAGEAPEVGAQTAEERRLEARLAALDQVMASFTAHAEATRFVAGFAAGDLLAPFTSAVADQVQQESWPTALAEAVRLLHDARDELVPVPQRSPAIFSRTSVPVRRALDDRLRRFPPSVTAVYREELDDAARKLMTEWRATSSPAALRRIVRELGFSTLAENAADTLGDLAFERGDFDAAFAWWQTLTHEETDQRSLRRRAKGVLASIFLNRLVQAQRDIQEWRRAHPDTTGIFAGRTGLFVDTLQFWLETRRGQLDEDAALPWSTFAGTITRNRALARAPTPRLPIEADGWQLPLNLANAAAPERGAPPKEPPRGPSSAKWRAPLYPIIVQDHVFVSDGQRVVCYDLATGRMRHRHEHHPPAPKAGAVPIGGHNLPLSAASGRVYAVLGGDTLVCLGATPTEMPPQGRLLWQVKAQAPAGQAAIFTSDALMLQDRAFIVVSRTLGVRAQHFLACYGARGGALLWVKPLYEGPANGSSVPRLLTCAGDRLVYATQQGVVLALDPWTGQPLWRVRYPTSNPAAEAREPAPAVYDGGRILVTPNDARMLLCIDAVSGGLFWELPVGEMTHLFGVSDGMAVFTTRQGIEAVDVRTGGAERRWRQPSVGRITTPGRGLLAGPFVFWPTADPELPWRVLALATGEPASPASSPDVAWDPSQWRALPPGHLIFGAGSLVAATADGITVLPASKSTRSGRE